MEALPHERSLVEEYKRRPFAIVGLNIDAENSVPGGLGNMIRQHKLNFPNIINAEKISDAWQLQAGQFVLLDHRGIIRKRGSIDELTSEETKKQIESLVSLAENNRS